MGWLLSKKEPGMLGAGIPESSRDQEPTEQQLATVAPGGGTQQPPVLASGPPGSCTVPALGCCKPLGLKCRGQTASSCLR